MIRTIQKVRCAEADCPRGDTERGDTLLEVLVAILLLGIAGVAVMTAFGEGIVMSGVHRRLTSTGGDGQAFAEKLTQAIDSSTIAYTACAAPNVYSTPPGFTPVAGDSVAVSGVSYWSGSAFVLTCTPSTDLGIQRVTVSVTNSDTRASRTLQIIIRKPCLLTDVQLGPCP